jgi:RimJ/RimL family protein N-acetyltransferase
LTPEPTATPRVAIEPWADSDLDLLRQINAPDMTEHLGGPETDAQVLARHRRYVAMDTPEAGQMFRVVMLPERVSAGSVGYWERTWQDESIYETGWSILPPFQGRGLATAATAAAIARVREIYLHRCIHAFPSIDHPASNAVCRKLGFTLVGEYDFEYPPGNPMRCNDWRLDLTSTI